MSPAAGLYFHGYNVACGGLLILFSWLKKGGFMPPFFCNLKLF